jgi:anti-anti-sigma factor
MLQIVVERPMDSALVRCSGRLVAGEEVLRLREAVRCQADKHCVQLDLAGVEAIDAAGLGLLVSFRTLGYIVGFELQVWNPIPRVRALLKLTRLESVLEIYPPDEMELQLSAGASSSDAYFEASFKAPSQEARSPSAPRKRYPLIRSAEAKVRSQGAGRCGFAMF